MKVLLFISLFIIIASDAALDINFDYENPYRTLGIAPWSTYDEIKDQYNKLVKIYHPDKTKSKSQDSTDQFIKIQNAYKKLKEKLKVDDVESEDEDIIMADLFGDTILIISSIASFILVCYIIITCTYNLFMWCWKYILFLSCFIVVFENVIPHYFSSLLTMIVCANIASLITLNANKIFSKIRGKKVKNE